MNTDNNEPRIRHTYTLRATTTPSPRLCAHHTAACIESNGWTAYTESGRDYCARWQDGECNSDPDEIRVAISHFEKLVSSQPNRSNEHDDHR